MGPQKKNTHIAHTFAQSMERRRAKRYRMSTAVIFHWMGPVNRRFQSEGAKRDMSAIGVFVLTPTCPPAKAVLHMLLMDPSREHGYNKKVPFETRL
jgi:hypothetical protein